ncbi:MAG: tRNA (adenosine(37)-N6)-threonylcarbamoyltransferase complex dimerization subunit type 1 TsaB [Alphaproteobacteria bacterium]|nr:tRNA (adenosine(37)-N6)-threonylcarbamoyltransferase complex dimerization subunit type 1 TsaB [Alphaproteobacteria bacterium]
MGSMLLLSLDTSLAACSVALWRDGALIADNFVPMARGHAEALVPMIQTVCAQAGADLAAVDAVAVTRGPGTFTGIRIGLATARGLALTIGCPVIGISTLEVIAASAQLSADIAPILVVQDARRGEIYAQRIGATPEESTAPQLLAVADLASVFTERPLRLVGSGALLAAERLGTGVIVAAGEVLPRAAVLAGLAAARLQRHGPAHFAVPPSPLYLRAPDAKLPAE